MDYNNKRFGDIVTHYENFWSAKAHQKKWESGPSYDLPPSFTILEFKPRENRRLWTYATCGMSMLPDVEAIELHIHSPQQSDGLVELLTAVAHYHVTGENLSLGHTVNFGRPWLPGSVCEYGLLSLPYLDGPDLEWMKIEPVPVRFLWLIPITKEERDYKKREGLEALESKFDAAGFNYHNPNRLSVV